MIEMSIGLIIVGILTATCIYQGRRMMDTALLQKTQEQIHQHIHAVISFKETYGAMPGMLKEASTLFNASRNGEKKPSEKGLDPTGSAALAWEHLYEAELTSKPDKCSTDGVRYPSARIGGGFSIIYTEHEAFLELGLEQNQSTGGPLLTKSQAEIITRNFGDVRLIVHGNTHVRQYEDSGGKNDKKYGLRIFICHY